MYENEWQQLSTIAVIISRTTQSLCDGLAVEQNTEGGQNHGGLILRCSWKKVREILGHWGAPRTPCSF